jgi:hypothetical protein
MKRLWASLFVAGLGLLASTGVPAAGEKKTKTTEKPGTKSGWVQLFNGKDLSGWKMHPKSPGKWYVKDGILHSGGKETSHLFSERGDYDNFHYRIEAKINDQGNSGQYFRTEFGPGYPKGYEAQINSTFKPDPRRTGSLYRFADIMDKLHEPDEWFTQEVIANGNHIQIILNGKKVVDYVDKKNTYERGHFALQQHGPAPNGPEVHLQVRKIEVKELQPHKRD